MHVLRSSHSSLLCSLSDCEEFVIEKFSPLFFLFVPDEIHPLALLIPVVLLIYYIFCIVVAVKRRCCSKSYKSILQFSFSMLATSKRDYTSFMCKDSPLPPFFSHHFLILEEIWLVGEGVTTPTEAATELDCRFRCSLKLPRRKALALELEDASSIHVNQR